MADRTYRVVINKDEDGTYVAEIPTLRHCVSYGSTMEEAMQNIREALEGVLLVMEEEGLPIPDDNNVVEYSINVPASLFSRSASDFATS
ncbi:type II toxin-antitoxin system HicB family antitoxin [Salmonirosea aquatica]|uniref:Type II toxin-antitoxin system HicB family antitoxin n=1 Tax=Salmonirosea aquatica TaxID=2654236 RepID=A0A7C9BPY8_9BACT|nr:type II toxin-antitoxin system HicB family antitoxin [Cytophagaceae bacterium SJW1-29]